MIKTLEDYGQCITGYDEHVKEPKALAYHPKHGFGTILKIDKDLNAFVGFDKKIEAEEVVEFTDITVRDCEVLKDVEGLTVLFLPAKSLLQVGENLHTAQAKKGW